MNKKFLLIPIALLALAACNNDGGSNSVSGSTNVSSTISTSVVPQKEYISVTALQSIMGTFTASGTISRLNVDSNKASDINLLYKYAGNAVELGSEFVGEEMTTQKYFNIDGYVEAYYLDADNVVKHSQVVTVDDDFNYVPVSWSYEGLGKNSNITVKSFEKTSEGLYTVTNQDLRDIIAAVVTGNDFVSASDCYVESMIVKVENDKISNIKIETSTYVYAGFLSDVTLKDSYDLNITDTGTTVVENDITPYSTSAEASVLTQAFKKWTDNVVVTDTKTTDGYVGVNKVYYTDEAFYSEENITSDDDGTTITKFGYYLMASEGYIYQFIVDADNTITTYNIYEGYSTLESAGLTYLGNSVAGEMFKYEGGKYVTRNAADAQTVGQYLLVDGNASNITELAITLTDDNSIDEITYSVSEYDDDYNTVTYNHTLKVENNTSGKLPIETFDNYKAELVEYLSINENMFGYWIDMASKTNISISLGGIYYGDTKVTDVVATETKITGKVDEKDIEFTYVAAADENSDDALSIVYDGKTINAEFDVISYITNYYGIANIPYPQNSTEYAAQIDSSTGIIYFAFYCNDGYTEEDLEEFVNTILETKGYLDISDYASDEIFGDQGSADKTVAELLEVQVALFDVTQYSHLVYLLVQDGVIYMMLK